MAWCDEEESEELEEDTGLGFRNRDERDFGGGKENDEVGEVPGRGVRGDCERDSVYAVTTPICASRES